MAKDLYHTIVRKALEDDGWLITHDPLTLKYGEQTSLYKDRPMDRVEELRQIVKAVVQKYAGFTPNYGEIEVDTVIDDAGGHYQLWNIGWQNKRRIHGCVLNVVLREGKLWIQHDGLGDGITNDLLEAGVKPEEIVLAFFTPAERKHLPFAVA